MADDIKVYAAVSLTDALRTIATKFEPISGDKLVFNFAGSNVLALQIKKGAPSDVFFSADEAQMDKLAKAGLINPATRHDIIFNQLVVVVGAASPLKISALGDLAQPGVRHLALADPKSVPAGVYAKAYLTEAKAWDAVQARVVPTENVRAALGAVVSGSAEAGIVYQTDAQVATGVKVALELPPSPKVTIAYPAAALSHAPNPTGAKKFIAYLQNNDDARAVFAKYGFILHVGSQPHGQ